MELTLSNSSSSFSLLPPYPHIFHGRESELYDVVKILVQDSAHVAILGAGGMGKQILPLLPSMIPKWKQNILTDILFHASQAPLAPTW
jgi:hypothetical protein